MTSKKQHTAELLKTHQTADGFMLIFGSRHMGTIPSEDIGDASFADDVVARFNACAGMADPAAEIAKLKAENAALREAVQSCGASAHEVEAACRSALAKVSS